MDAGTRILPMNDDVAKCFQTIIEEREAPKVEKIGSDWEKLNELAHEAFAKADKCLKEKQYKTFAIRLRPSPCATRRSTASNRRR